MKIVFLKRVQSHRLDTLPSRTFNSTSPTSASRERAASFFFLAFVLLFLLTLPPASSPRENTAAFSAERPGHLFIRRGYCCTWLTAVNHGTVYWSASRPRRHGLDTKRRRGTLWSTCSGTRQGKAGSRENRSKGERGGSVASGQSKQSKHDGRALGGNVQVLWLRLEIRVGRQ